MNRRQRPPALRGFPLSWISGCLVAAAQSGQALERAAAGMPTEQKASRIRSVEEIVKPYLDGYELNHRAKSVLFSKGT
jgi:hypothetical protein